MWLKHRKYSVHEKHERSHTHTHLSFTHYIFFYMSFPCPAIIYKARKEKLFPRWYVLKGSRWGVFFFFFSFTVACSFAGKRPQRCRDWWEGMIYVAPVSQLSSGPLSLITAIRLPPPPQLVSSAPRLSQPPFCLISIKGKAVYFHLTSPTAEIQAC